MQWLTAGRALLAALFLAALVTPQISRAGETASRPSTSDAARKDMVIGFVGGFVSHDNAHHGVVQMAEQIRKTLPPGTYVRVFENRHRRQALAAVVRRLDSDGDGTLSDREKSRAHIVLFGQSWGASAAVTLARDLQRQGVPVLLTVQVDSVAKLWQNDSIIPRNVGEAINFYQPHGLVHGRRRISAADPARTEILGNYRVDYREHPVRCPDASWFDRLVTPSHMQSECDPGLWSQIEFLVRERLATQQTSAQSVSDVPAGFYSKR